MKTHERKKRLSDLSSQQNAHARTIFEEEKKKALRRLQDCQHSEDEKPDWKGADSALTTLVPDMGAIAMGASLSLCPGSAPHRCFRMKLKCA